MIVTDDQASWTLGSYGNADARTSQIDRLAAEGVRFSNVFTPSPVCSPSRATMLSGRYGTQVGITDWINPQEAEAGVGLPPETTTWAEALQTGRIPHRPGRQMAPGLAATLPPDPPRVRVVLRLPGRWHRAHEPAVVRRNRRREGVPGAGARRAHRCRASLPRAGARPAIRVVAPLSRATHPLRPRARAGPRTVPRGRRRHPRLPRSRPGTGAPVDARVLREHPFDRSQRRPTARHVAADRPRPDARSSSSRATTATTSGTTACTPRATAPGSSAA